MQLIICYNPIFSIYCITYKGFLSFLRSEDNKYLLLCRHVMMSLVFVFFFIAKTTNLYWYDVT